MQAPKVGLAIVTDVRLVMYIASLGTSGPCWCIAVLPSLAVCNTASSFLCRLELAADLCDESKHDLSTLLGSLSPG